MFQMFRSYSFRANKNIDVIYKRLIIFFAKIFRLSIIILIFQSKEKENFAIIAVVKATWENVHNSFLNNEIFKSNGNNVSY